MNTRIATYISVGFCVAIFQYVAFYIFFEMLALSSVFASSISFILTVLVSFFLQKHITFRLSNDERSMSTILSLTLYSVNALLGLFINIVIVYYGVEILQISPYLVQAISMLVLATYNFFIYRLILL
jgi:putative flippase GtrA